MLWRLSNSFRKTAIYLRLFCQEMKDFSFITFSKWLEDESKKNSKIWMEIAAIWTSSSGIKISTLRIIDRSAEEKKPHQQKQQQINFIRGSFSTVHCTRKVYVTSSKHLPPGNHINSINVEYAASNALYPMCPLPIYAHMQRQTDTIRRKHEVWPSDHMLRNFRFRSVITF